MWRNTIFRKASLFLGVCALLIGFMVSGSQEVSAQASTLDTINRVNNAYNPFGISQTYINNQLAERGAAVARDSISAAIATVSISLLQLVSWAFGITGLFFDFIIDKTVVNAYGQLVANDGLRLAIQTAWTLIRDLINLSFIFILLYQSIMLILGRSSEVGKVIVRLVMVALLINFSMFITRVVVDASNIVATGFYDQIHPIETESGDQIKISTMYMRALGIQGVFEGGLEQIVVSGALQGDTYIIALRNFGSLVFITVTMFVFLAAAIMFLVRYIMIVFLMILSPVAFAGYIIPGTKGLSDKWWETLIGQALFAPIFMVLTWVNITLASRLLGASEGNALGDIFAQGQDGVVADNAMAALFTFSLLIGLAIASLVIAKQFANKGGSSFGKINSVIGGVALGATAWGGRRTVGQVGQWASENDRLKKWAREGKYGAQYAARAGLYTADKAAKSSLELRNAPLGIGSTIFGDMGKAGGEGGFRKDAERKAEKYEEAIKRRSGASSKTLIDLSEAQSDLKNKKAVLANEKEGTPAYLTAQQAVWEAQNEVKKKQKVVDRETKASTKEMARNLPSSGRVAKFFTPNQKAKELASDKLTKTEDKEEQEREMAQSVSSHVDAILGKTSPVIYLSLKPEQRRMLEDTFLGSVDNKTGKRSGGLSDKQIASLPAKTLTSPHTASFVSRGALEALRRKGELDATQRADIGANLRDFMAIIAANPTAYTPEQHNNAVAVNHYLGTQNGAYWA